MQTDWRDDEPDDGGGVHREDRAPTWVKVAATILGAVAALIAVIFAGLNFMKHGT